MSRISPSDLAELVVVLSGRTIGRRIEQVAECGSTQDLVRALGEGGESEGTVVLAERQTQGRGQRGNLWQGAAGKDLAFSFLLTPPALPAVALAAILPLGVCLGLEEALGRRFTVKWPNDVLHGGRKVAGILIEGTTLAGRTTYAVGVGVNVNTTGFPPELADRAGSLSQITGGELDRAGLLATLLISLDDVYRELCTRDASRLLGILWTRLGLQGQDVELVCTDQTRRGRVLALDLQRLRYRDEQGREQELLPETITRIVPVTTRR
jgi:BirA family biotin operon repressor/biotin-[acetyl-CoA-carboxylase] ligase